MAETSIIGLKNLVAWEVTADTELSLTHGAVVPLGGSIEATISPDTAEASVQYADDIEYDSLTPDSPYNIEIDIAGMTVANQAWLQGHSVAADGGLVIQSGDTPPYIALAWKSEKADGTYRYVVIYKAKPEFMARTYKTKEGTTVTRQTSKMTLKAVSRVYDGLKQYIFDGTEPAGFFTTPHVPVVADEIVITTQPLDLALASGDGGELSIVAAVGEGVPDTYKWYKATGKTYTGATASAYTGHDTATLTIPTDIADNTTHYFFCKLSNAGSHDVYSEIAVVIVADGL